MNDFSLAPFAPIVWTFDAHYTLLRQTSGVKNNTCIGLASRIYEPYMTVHIVVHGSARLARTVYTVYMVYIIIDFPAKNTVYTLCIYMVLANPIHAPTEGAGPVLGAVFLL
jgi:hypothetical protein